MCGRACAAGQICQAGACVVSCPAGQTECAGSCRDINGDNMPDLVALGMSAISQVGDTYVQNVKGLEAYYAALAAGRLPIERGVRLTRDDLIRRHVIQRLMCDAVMSFTEVEARFGLDFSDYFAGELVALQPLVADGLVVREAQGLRITPVGRPLMRNVAMVFDAYLQAPADAGRLRHSRTV